MALTKVSPGLLNAEAQAQGFRNRIINGAMEIDQRNAGAAVTVNDNSPFYATDRFQFEGQATDGVFTAQQDTSAPTGFNNSVKVTVTTADASIGVSQRYQLNQKIEGFNVADLGFGAAGAKTSTLSFWVRSSLTGTFGGAYRNSAANRSYPFSYTISVADTWEYKTITIAGDTSGTWLTTNGTGLIVTWSLGSGTNFQGTAGAWNSSNNNTVTGETQLIGTLNATWYITGVQLEVGSVATEFERRPYGTELALCQRYFEAVVAAGNNSGICSINSDSTTTGRAVYAFKTTKRTNPSVTFASAGSFLYQGASINSGLSAISLAVASTQTIMVDMTAPSHTQWATANLLENTTAGTVLFAISAEL